MKKHCIEVLCSEAIEKFRKEVGMQETREEAPLEDLKKVEFKDSVDVARGWALAAARAADSKKASDIMVQDVRELVSITDYFVIVTASNARQVEAVIDEIEESLRKEAHIKPNHTEDSRDGSWSLLDYGDVVIHVFMPEARDYYRLEELWNDAPIINLAEEAGLTEVSYSTRIAELLAE